jgi:predicted nucleic acid-binding protein
MRIIIDTSMIFSLLLGKNAEMRDTFFDPMNIFYAPNYIIGELFEKKEKIMKYSALSETEIYELFHRILSKIEFVAENFVSSEYKSQAFGLCQNIDEDDIPFIALSLQLNAVFWTGDKKLKNYLKEQEFALFFEPNF